MSARSSQWSSRRASPRPRTPPNWSPSIMRRLPAVTHSRSGGRAGRAARARRRRANISLDAEVGDPARHRGGLRQRPRTSSNSSTWVQRIAGVPMEPRAAIGAYDPATGRYTLLCRDRRRGPPAAGPGDDPRRRRRPGAGRHARGRRQFRHARLVQSGIRARHLGGAPGRPSGQMDLRAQRGVPLRLPGARPGGRGRAGARPRRQIPRNARLQHRQCRRLPDRLRSARTRASRSCRASTTCRPCISAPAPRSPTHCRPAPIAAPGAPRSCSSWSG